MTMTARAGQNTNKGMVGEGEGQRLSENKGKTW